MGTRPDVRVLHCMWSGETGGAERAVYLLLREQLASRKVEPAILYGQGSGPYARRHASSAAGHRPRPSHGGACRGCRA